MASRSPGPPRGRAAEGADRDLALVAEITDVYDGLARILGDAQRFGFTLRALRLAAGEGGHSVLRFRLGTSAETDTTALLSRLRRHPSIVALERGRSR